MVDWYPGKCFTRGCPQEFGLYDDNPEVETFDGSGFFEAVDSGGMWFVNFYSPGCSHCHHLAPAWRVGRLGAVKGHWIEVIGLKLNIIVLVGAYYLPQEMAKELYGAVGIGAVNCRENWHLCSQLRIRGYPTLLLFRDGMSMFIR